MVNAASSAGGGHLEELPLLVQEVLGSLSLRPADIGEFGVVTGPGGFTGLRIGVSFISTMASLVGAEVVPLNALDLLAAEVVAVRGSTGPGTAVLVVVDGRRNEVFWGLYLPMGGVLERLGESHTRPEDLAAEGLAGILDGSVERLLVAGSGLDRYAERIQFPAGLEAVDTGVRAASDVTVASTYARLSMEDSRVPANGVEIVYLRGADAVAKFGSPAGSNEGKEPSGQ